MGADEKLAALCIVLPPLKLPPGMVLPFPWVNVRGDRHAVVRQWLPFVYAIPDEEPLSIFPDRF